MKLTTLNKRVFLALMTIFAVFASQFAAAPAKALANDTLTITVHYNRLAADYDNWNLWIWKNMDSGTDGAGFEFKFDGEDSFGKTVTFKLDGMKAYDNVGIIARLGNWSKKDVGSTWPNGGDRFIKNFDASGKAEIWLVEGDKEIYTKEPTIGAVKPQINAAILNDFKAVTLTLNGQYTLKGTATEDFSLAASNGTAATITSVTLPAGKTASNFVTLNLSANVDVSMAYTVTHPTYGKASVTVGAIMDSKAFADAYTYTGNDLGNTYSPAKTDFRVWAPTATSVKLVTFATLIARTGTEIEMTKAEKGTWTASVTGDQHQLAYVYRANVGGTVREAVDPYVRAVTIEGDRGVVVDLSKTNPTKWTPGAASKPAFSGKPTDAVIYETHVRDLSIDSNSGIPVAHKGKFLAFTDYDTTTTQVVVNKKTKKKTVVKTKNPSGISAIKDLGISHIQFLPIYDYASVVEAKPSFNWGYDPKNFNAPEGSYSTKPAEPTNRITELKTMVQSLHDNGIRVIMDVVYNHVWDAGSFSQEQLVPGYFFRTTPTGELANGTGVGNETASERPMVRKFIVDSIKYWASEYNLDGFRFDLMGIHDITTMQQVRAELTKIDPTIIILGEGWNMGDILPSAQKAAQINASSLPGISMFNDQIRDSLKGSVFDSGDRGWATAKYTAIDGVKAGVVGNIFFDRFVNGNWTTLDPGQSVNYVEAHDNLSLYDKLKASKRGSTEAQLATYHRLATSVVMLAQGMPFIQAGQEFLRTKNGDENSYKSSDAVNSLKWNSRATNIASVNYYNALLAIRKAHPAFRMDTAAAVKATLTFLNVADPLIGYSINGQAAGDSWNTIVVIHNPTTTAKTITLPSSGDWNVVVSGAKASATALSTLKGVSTVSVPALSTWVAYKN
jgi:1,4-alpha-glucan branching enzyme